MCSYSAAVGPSHTGSTTLCVYCCVPNAGSSVQYISFSILVRMRRELQRQVEISQEVFLLGPVAAVDER